MRLISLLRGINVGGHKKIKMVDLKARYEEWGFAETKTYIQSGNVLFLAEKWQPEVAKKRIEEGIAEAYGFEVPVEIRTTAEWTKVISGHPFGDFDVAAEGSKYAVLFLSAKPKAQDVKALMARVVAPEEVVVSGREIYLHCPDGFARTKLTNTLFERMLKVSATARNWKSVLKLQEMATE
ncbi:MAG: hypothetical protein ACI9UK_001037 [Candidatus Krumholzibacteriia bacterium]|jgi:uncharacterized protein (DUF1697 family)